MLVMYFYSNGNSLQANRLKRSQDYFLTMGLLPRWEVMTDEAKVLVKRVAFSALALMLAIWLVRALIPWLIVAMGGYWTFRWLSKTD